MSEPKLISPLLDGFVMGAPISSHNGVRCCPAMKQNTDEKYIVKIISIPSSQNQLDALLLTGAYKDPAEAMDYFKSQADAICQEAEFLHTISRLEGFLPYEGCQVVPMDENRLGYQVYLLGSYKRSLDRHIRRGNLSSTDAVKLGIDICTALSACRRAGSIYIALKPTNIFLSEDMEYRISDLGFTALDSLRYMSMPAKFRSKYAAPETLDPMQTLNETVDTYALGMILYQICNNGKLPEAADGEPIPAPSEAPDQLSAVIMKAISADPAERWSDPTQFGRALVACLPEEQQEHKPSTMTTTHTQVYSTEAVNAALNSRQDSDTKVLPTGAITQAVQSDTRVIPSVQIREAVSSETKVIPEVKTWEPAAKKTAENAVAAETKVLPKMSQQNTPPANVAVKEPDYAEDAYDDEYDDPDDEPVTVAQEKRKRKPIGKGWIAPVIILVILAILGCGAYYYYQNYYLQTIDSLSVDGMYNQLTVTVVTQIDESLLSITCTDTYGNSMYQPLQNGKAEFTDLLPNSQYKIQLEMEGFHKLVGKTSDVFNTESRTDIISFTGITGAEDGSVMLNFTVDGPEPSEWIIYYSAEGEEELSQHFTGHSITIKNLVVPKKYTFRLSPAENIYVSGQTTLEYTASAIVMAQNLIVSAVDGSDMTVRWEEPANAVVDLWSVRCYSDDGFDKTIETTDNKAVFTGINVSRGYHVEVTASGMTQPARTSVTANPITITSFQVNVDDSSKLTIHWDHKGQSPDGGWLILYSLDGFGTQSVVKCSDTTAEISPRIHGAQYRFTIQAADNTSIFSNIFTFDCPNAEVYDDHSFNAEKVVAYLVVTPEKNNWTSADVNKDDYTDTFSVGQPISVILYCPARFYIPEDTINILYVIRNAEGQVITKLTSQAVDDWHDMWVHYNTSYAELDVPTVPTELGQYNISIYFNGKAVASTDFTIVE